MNMTANSLTHLLKNTQSTAQGYERHIAVPDTLWISMNANYPCSSLRPLAGCHFWIHTDPSPPHCHHPLISIMSHVFDSSACKCSSLGGVCHAGGGMSPSQLSALHLLENKHLLRGEGSCLGLSEGGTGNRRMMMTSSASSRSVAVRGWMEVEWNENGLWGWGRATDRGRDKEDGREVGFFFLKKKKAVGHD